MTLSKQVMATEKTPPIVVVAFVLSLLGFLCGLPAVLGLILGLVGRGKAKAAGKGRGLAVAAIVVSCAWLLLFALVGIAGSGESAGDKAKDAVTNDQGSAVTQADADASATADDAEVSKKFAAHSDIQTEKGMSYSVSMTVGLASIEREDLAPNDVNMLVRVPVAFSVTNQTDGFDADLYIQELSPHFYLPQLPLSSDGMDFELLSLGLVGPIGISPCDGMFEPSMVRLGPGESKMCEDVTEMELTGLTAAEADATALLLDGLLPPVIEVPEAYGRWARPAGSSGDDPIVGERAEECGRIISQWSFGAPFCAGSGRVREVVGRNLSFSQIVGRQERPSFAAEEIDENSTWITLATPQARMRSTDVRLDLVQELQEECTASRAKAEDDLGNLWRPGQPIQFVVTDPESFSGLAFREGVSVDTQPDSINEELVERGLWVPSGHLENPAFDPRKKVSASNLPYAVPSPMPDDWSQLRRMYAPRIVKVGNEAAASSGTTHAAGCASEVRAILLQQDKDQEAWVLEFDREQEEFRRNGYSSGGSSGGSFNIPGWLCPGRC